MLQGNALHLMIGTMCVVHFTRCCARHDGGVEWNEGKRRGRPGDQAETKTVGGKISPKGAFCPLSGVSVSGSELWVVLAGVFRGHGWHGSPLSGVAASCELIGVGPLFTRSPDRFLGS